jgi:histidinol-phosphate/aromatic aminotransferase/cobyric acid decarboxylase-like protein
MMTKTNNLLSSKIKITLATEQDHNEIYRFRHEVYACELGQHQRNPTGMLTDVLDDYNIYIVAKNDDEIIGFVSVTPPNPKGYSIDKYFARTSLPITFDSKLYEIRLLTVLERHRSSKAAGLLMYAAFRWIEDHGGERIVAIGRSEILNLYLKIGLKPLGYKTQSGAVSFELLTETVHSMRSHLSRYNKGLKKVESKIDWCLAIPFHKIKPCFHGGAFFKAVGEEFDNLDKSREIINADVLDAWYPPSPKVIMVLQEYLPWLSRTSPPINCQGLVETIARVRKIDQECVLPGAGSSDLIFLAFRQWLNSNSRVLILDPSYGEYGYICEQVIGCRVDRIVLSRSNDYRFKPSILESYFRNNYDLIVLVNPNNPTGHLVLRKELEEVLQNSPKETKMWIDEAYIEYAGQEYSLEHFAGQSTNVIVCKSMSKCYALSGMRVAYLCGPRRSISELKEITPPWPVSLPAQVAAVMALQDPQYYAERYKETHKLRNQLAEQLKIITGAHIVPSVGNFLLCHLPYDGPDGATLNSKCKKHNLFLRDFSSMSRQFDKFAFRIAVKDERTNAQMLEILKNALSDQ